MKILTGNDLRSGAETMDERWFGLLGYDEGEIETDAGKWLAHVHPDDRQQFDLNVRRCLDESDRMTVD